ncbi:hypothetical protein ACIA5A_19090 [Micromonospora sp. NPDC051300]
MFSDLAAALAPPTGDTNVATVLDLPPAAGAPPLGRAWICQQLAA